MLAAIAAGLLRLTLPDPCAAPPAAAEATTAARRVCVLAGGDVFFGRYLPAAADKPRYKRVTVAANPFAGLEPLVARADIAFANLETPVIEEPTAPFAVGDTLTFRADGADIASIAAAGFDVVSLANNHMGNFGTAGAANTRRVVEAAGMAGPGAGADDAQARMPAIIERNGMKIAFLALTAWDNFDVMSGPDGAVAHTGRMGVARAGKKMVIAARGAGADVVVVSVHWGREYERGPDDLQRQQAAALIRAGADVVLGHHPHVVQPVERIGKGVVAWSLGNLLFDQVRRVTRASLLVGLVIEPGKVVAINLVPVAIDPRTHLPSIAQAPRDCWVWQELAAGGVGVSVPDRCRMRLAAR